MKNKVIGWYKRHKELRLKEGWRKEEYDIILEDILYENIKTLDELIPKLNNKSIYDLMNLLQNELKIKNKPVNVIFHCAYCGKEFIRNMNELHKDRVYCSMECRNKYKKDFGVHRGNNNPKYNSKIIFCTNCGKGYKAPKYVQEQTNSYGDNNHFCSQKCYWEYRSKYYRGEKSAMHNHVFSQYQINKMRQNTVKMFSEGKFPTKLTSIHKKIDNLLDVMNIQYKNEKPYKYYSVDIYLPQYNLIIEIMGDYFHGNPLKYPKENLNKMQLKNIRKDKAKHTYIKRYYNIDILYLWESDINNNIEKCKDIISIYIENQGKIDKYHSYQYN